MSIRDAARAAITQPSIPLWLFALPLIAAPYVPHEISWSKFLRAVAIIAMVVLLLASSHHRRTLVTGFRRLPSGIQLLTTVFVVLACLSSFHGHASAGLILFGNPTDNQGLLIWLSYVLLGMYAGQHLFQTITKRQGLLIGIGAVVLLESIALNFVDLLHGYRLTGSLFQATDVGIWACLVMAIALFAHQRGWFTNSVVWLSATCVLLSQSRVAILAALLIALYAIVYSRAQFHPRSTAQKLAIFGYLLLTPFAFKQLFIRLQPSIVGYGTEYRGELYRFAAHRIVDLHLWLLGTGAGNGGAALNSGTAPDFIAQTRADGFVFWYAHDLLLDFGIMFGAVAAVCFAAIVAWAGYHIIRHGLWRDHPIAISWFAVLLLNAIFNTPSLELTPLLLVTIYGVFFVSCQAKNNLNGGPNRTTFETTSRSCQDFPLRTSHSPSQ